MKAVFFDLDETLLDYEAAHYRDTIEGVCMELCGLHEGLVAETLLAAYLESDNNRWSSDPATLTGSLARAIWLETWREALVTCGLSSEEVAAGAVEIYRRRRGEAYRLFDDALAVLEHLHGKVVLGLITNGPVDSQKDKIDALGLGAYFDVIVISGEVGIAKPDAALFRHALAVAGVDAADAWHIGDNIRSDVGGAIAAGMTAVWLNRYAAIREADHPEPHHEITSLAELVDILTLA